MEKGRRAGSASGAHSRARLLTLFGSLIGAFLLSVTLLTPASAATVSTTNATGVNVSREGCLETDTCGAGYAAGLGGDDFEPQIAADSGVTGGVDYSKFLYQSWSHFTTTFNSTIYFSRSTDGGQTWSTPAALPGQPSLGNANDDSRMYIDPSNHNLYLTYLSFNSRAGEIYLAKSTDQGVTWTYSQVNTTQRDLSTSCGAAQGQIGCDLHQVVASGSNVWVAMGPFPDTAPVPGSRPHYMASSTDGGATFTTKTFGVDEYFPQPVGGAVDSTGSPWFLWADCHLPGGATSCYGAGGGGVRTYVSKTTGAGAAATTTMSNVITNSASYPDCPIPSQKKGCSVDGAWGQPASFGMDSNNNLYMAYMTSASAGAAPTVQWRYCLAAAANCGPTGVGGWTAGAQVSDTTAGFHAIQPRIVVRGSNSVGVTWLDDRNGSTTSCAANSATGNAPHTCGWRVYYRTSTTASSVATGWSSARDMWAYNAITDSEVGAGFFWPYGDTGAAVVENGWAGNQPMAIWSQAARYIGNQGHMLTGTPAAYAVTDLTATGGYRQIQLNWTASTQTNAGTLTYSIYRGTSPTSITTPVATVSGNSYLDTGATGDLTTYYYKVVTVSSTNGTGFPAFANATTLDTRSVTFTNSGLSADASGTVLSVNGTNYTYAQLPVTLNLPQGTNITYAWTNTVPTASGTKRYALTTPAPSPASPFTLNSNTTVTGTYKTQVQATFTAPAIASGGGTGSNTVFTVGGTTYTAASLGTTSWWDVGAPWSFADPVATADPDKRYKLGAPTSGTLTTGDAGSTKTGAYVVQWRPTFTLSGIGGDTGTNTVATIGGVGYGASDFPVTVWVSDGASWSYATPVSTSPASPKQYRRTSTASGTVTSSAGAAGTYVTQYQVTFTSSGIGSDTGTNTIATVGATTYARSALPVTGFFDDGTSYSFSSPVATSPASTKRYRRTSSAGGTVGSGIAGTTVTGTYVAQQQVTFAAPAITSGGDTGGNIVFSVGGANYGASSLGTAFWDEGLAWSFADPVAAGTNKRYKLASPTSGTIGSGDGGTTKTGTYGVQWQVTFSQSGIGSDTGTNPVLNVGGLDRSASQLPHGPNWYAQGTPYSWYTPVDTSPVSPRYYNLISVPAASTITSGGSISATYDAYQPATPDTSIDSGPSGVTLDTSATFTFSSDINPATFECRLDGGAWIPCTSPKNYTGLGVGSHTFEVRATSSGVTDPAPASRTWSITDIIPATTITSGPPIVTESTSATFEFTSDQPGSTFECRLDGGAWDPCTTPRTYNGLALGPHTFQARAIYNGITDQSPPSRSWTIVDIVPVTQIDSGPASLTTSTNASFTFSSDQPGSTFECRLDGGTWSSCTSPKSYLGVTLGTHLFEVRAIYNGVMDPSPPGLSWTVVAVIPDTQIDSGPDATTTNTTATFTFSSDQPSATFECRLDGGAWGACTSPRNYLGLSVTSHTFDVRSIYDGVTDPSPASRSWTITPIFPETEIDSGPSGNTTSRSATFIFSSDQPAAGFECRLDSGAWDPCTSPQDYVDLGVGSHTFDVRGVLGGVRDPSPASRTWTIDAIVPDTWIDSGPLGTTTDVHATFEFSSDQPGTTFECSMDGGEWTACTSPQVYSGLSVTAHNFEVRAVLDGVTDPIPPSRTWTIASVIPTTVLDTGPSGTTTSRTATFTFSSDQPAATFECRLDGAPWGACASPLDYLSLPLGTHTFYVRAVLDGIKDPAPPGRTWTIANPTSTSLTIKTPAKVKPGAQVRISGSLVSADTACSVGQQVKLKKGSKVVQKKDTTLTGTYKFALKITKKTSIQVVFAGTESCASSVSKKRTIRVAR